MMKLAKTIATVSIALGSALCFAGGVLAQATPAPAHKITQAAVVKPSPASASKTAPPKPAPKMASAPAAAKPAAMKPVKSPMAPKSVAAKTAPKVTPKVDAKVDPKVGMTASPDQTPSTSPVDTGGIKRDPFVALVNDRKEGGGPTLPAGIPGLVVATVRVDGTVRSGSELIAVVSNPERHVFFVRQGDQLYDGSVEKIDLDGVTFHEDSKDAFGKPVVRDVTKRIYASAGEQQ